MKDAEHCFLAVTTYIPQYLRMTCFYTWESVHAGFITESLLSAMTEKGVPHNGDSKNGKGVTKWAYSHSATHTS